MEVTNFYNYGTMNKVEAGATQINNYYGSREAEKEPVEEAADEEKTSTPQLPPAKGRQARDEELCHFIHPSLDGDEEWRIHDEVRSLVKRQGIQEICLHLTLLKKNGMRPAGVNPQRDLVEIVELEDHPWFVACQFHPEFKSRPDRPHPLFDGFIGAALKAKEQ